MIDWAALALALNLPTLFDTKWAHSGAWNATSRTKITLGRLLRGPLYLKYSRTKQLIELRIKRLNKRRTTFNEPISVTTTKKYSCMTDRALAKLQLQLRTLESGMRWATAARLGLIVGVTLWALLALTVVTNEIRETYDALHPAEPYHRGPEQSWGYTPLLAELPKPVMKFGVWYSKTAESIVALVIEPTPAESSLTAKLPRWGYL